jgi:hypothetical protein
MRKRTVNSPQAARDCLLEGIRTIPLKPNTKKPKSGTGWNKLIIEERDISRHFKIGDNIGGLWGDPSGGIVDMDLDCDEAVDIAYHLLPETRIYGRVKNPTSHYLFRCKGISTIKRLSKTEGMIVELRSTGTQSVLPPSIHDEDRDRYCYENGFEILTVSESKLREYVNCVAIGAMFLRFYPEQGGRHEFVHRACGAFLHQGWKRDLVIRFFKALFACISDNEMAERIRTVKNTIDNFEKRQRIQGWPSLVDFIDQAIIDELKGWATPLAQFDMPMPKIAPRTVSEREGFPVFPKELLNPPGLVGDLAKWSAHGAYSKIPAFSLSVGLMATAFFARTKYKVSVWDTPLQPYFMLLAPPSAGKDAGGTALKKVANYFESLNDIYQGAQSYQSLLDKLASDGRSLFILDEAARHFQSASNPASQSNQILTQLTSLYGQAFNPQPEQPARHNPIPAIETPFLLFYGNAQPELLMESISKVDLATGLLNRMVLFDAGDEQPAINLDRESLRLPSVAVKKIRAIEEFIPSEKYEKRSRENKPYFSIPFHDTKAYNHFRNFEQFARELVDKGREFGPYGRANQNALVIAGIIAVGVDPINPEIDLPIAEYATRLITHSCRCWTYRFTENMYDTQFQRKLKQVERIITEARKFAGGNRLTKAENSYLKKGFISRALINRKTNGISPRELDDIFRKLLEAEVIGYKEIENDNRRNLNLYWKL